MVDVCAVDGDHIEVVHVPVLDATFPDSLAAAGAEKRNRQDSQENQICASRGSFLLPPYTLLELRHQRSIAAAKVRI